MALFGRKSSGTTACRRCAVSDAAGTEPAKPGGLSVKILGSGCAKCNALEAAAKEALLSLGMAPAVDHVTDALQIAAYGVMSTPALVANGRVLSCGRTLKADEIVKLLQSAAD